MDVHSKNVRSFNMSRIKNKNTKPEILIRKIYHKLGLFKNTLLYITYFILL